MHTFIAFDEAATIPQPAFDALVKSRPLLFSVEIDGVIFSKLTLEGAARYKRADPTAHLYPTRPITGNDFADFGDRKLLADTGYFSCDLPKHRAKRDAEAQRVRYLGEAYEVLHLDRNQQHALIAARLEAGRTDGVWARSTKEYSEACTRLDKFVLLASPAIAQSIKDTEHG